MKTMFFALLALSSAFAANPITVITSAQPLIGALSSVPGVTGSFRQIHLPGYGLELTGSYISSTFGATDVEIDALIEDVETILQGLSGTVQGLDQGDWVSVGAEVVTEAYFVVRMKPGQAETLEVWPDGQKQ